MNLVDINKTTIIFCTFGAYGDIFPFLGLAINLKERGFPVVFATNPYYKELIEREGIQFKKIGTIDDHLDLSLNPNLWKGAAGAGLFFKKIASIARYNYQAIMDEYVKDKTLVIYPSFNWGPQFVQEIYNVPTITIQLSPWRSIYNPSPIYPLIKMLPMRMRPYYFKLADKLSYDHWLLKGINDIRQDLHLLPLSTVMDTWLSPNKIIGLFPDWFFPTQPDWPAQFQSTGFPLYVEKASSPLSEALVNFLDKGSSPIVFSLASGMRHFEDFYLESIKVCQMLKCRGILVSRYENTPKELPQDIIKVDYAPFNKLLPHCKALVHVGGIGACAQALSAGIPQFIIPFTFDQPENADRVQALHLGTYVKPKKYIASIVYEKLKKILDSSEIHENCLNASQKIKSYDAIEETCKIIEKFTLTT